MLLAKTRVRPCLKVGDVLVLDNLGAHRASRIEEIAKSCGASVIWLPPYSPDFSPIEQMWSKLTTHLRKAKARTIEELDRAGKVVYTGLGGKQDLETAIKKALSN